MKSGSLAATHLLCNGIMDPLGVDTERPLLSWIAESNAGQRGQRQAGYRIRAASDPQDLVKEGPCLWDTGWVASGASLQIPWGGPSPESRQAIWWTVSLRNDAGRGRSAERPGAVGNGAPGPGGLDGAMDCRGHAGAVWTDPGATLSVPALGVRPVR